MATHPGLSIVCPVIVGRTSQLELLSGLVRRARDGAGHTVLLSGEAGVGKSRLIAEVEQLAVANGMRIMSGTCFDQDRSLPFAPFVDLLQTRCLLETPETLADDVGPWGPDLVKLVPSLRTILPDCAPRPSLDPEQDKRQLFDALIHFFINAASHAPLMLVLEDMHWADDTSVELLLHLARRASGHAVLLLISYRGDEVGANLGHLLAELDRLRLATELSLMRLSPADVETMVRAIFDSQRPITAGFLDRLYALTEGNPFYVEEMLKSLLAEGSLVIGEGRWDDLPLTRLQVPRGVQDVIKRRVTPISPACGEVLKTAAVAGRRFDFALLRALTGLDEPELLSCVKELVGAQLVAEESEERFRFRHALTREAVYWDLLARERQALHRRVADAIEQVYAGSLDPHTEDLAYHHYEAGAWEQALEYASRAGARAQALYTPRAAVEHFSRALEVARQLSITPPMAVHRGRGNAYEMLGEFDPARSDFEAALQLARADGNAPDESRALLDLGLLWAGQDYARTGDYFRQALDLARAIGDQVTLAQSLNRLGNWYANVEQPDQALRHHHEALAIVQAIDDRRALAETFDLLGMASFLGGDPHHCAHYYEQAVELFRDLDERQGLASTLATLAVSGPTYQLSVVVPAARSPAGFARAGEEALRITREIGWRSGEAYALGTLAQCLGARGEYARALELGRDAIAIAQEIGHHQWLTHAHWATGMIMLDLLALSEAREHLEHALGLARATGSTHWIRNVAAFLASVWTLEGDMARAGAVLDEALDRDAPDLTLGQRLVWCSRAELALAKGDAPDALRIVDRLVASAAATAPSAGERGVARLMKVRGEALAGLGQMMEAEAALRAAQSVARAHGTRPLLWRIQTALGALHRRQRRHQDAAAEFADARTIIEGLAAEIHDAALRENFLSRATAMLPRARTLSPRLAAKQAFGGLTAREREVAALIARGRSNREIAETLFIAERTVETHTSNILAKLDHTSRTQIAAWAVANGLAQPD